MRTEAYASGEHSFATTCRTTERTFAVRKGNLMLQAEHNPALNASVLVLNRGYMAVHIVNVRRAFGLLYRDLAEVLDIE